MLFLARWDHLSLAFLDFDNLENYDKYTMVTCKLTELDSFGVHNQGSDTKFRPYRLTNYPT